MSNQPGLFRDPRHFQIHSSLIWIIFSSTLRKHRKTGYLLLMGMMLLLSALANNLTGIGPVGSLSGNGTVSNP